LIAGQSGGFLVLRRGPVLWGIANIAVSRLSQHAGRYRVAAGACALAADEVLGVAGELAVRPVGRAVARFWPEAAVGFALYAGRPVVVIDPARPPQALCLGEGETG
jgi:hypothetical protein